MHTLLRLPLILLEMALRQGAGAVRDILRLVAGGGEDESPSAPAERPAPARRDAEAVGAQEARARRPEARPRNAGRRRPATPPERSGDEASGRGRVEPPAHVSAGAETVASFGPADDPSPAIDVRAPWDGYDAHSAAEIIKRVRATDEATKAVVLLYERGHKGRASVIRAAGGERSTA